MCKNCKEIIEIYAGMEGFIPETAPEAYLQNMLKKMYDCAVQPDTMLDDVRALGELLDKMEKHIPNDTSVIAELYYKTMCMYDKIIEHLN